MHGFQKRAPKAQNYADGGLVSSIKRLVGINSDPGTTGPVQQAPAQSATTPLPPQALGTGMAAQGMRTLQNRKAQLDEQERQAMGYADGGPVRGPGTGTSDDIETEVPQGSYIMPADSTAQIGEQSLQDMGEPTPVNLSNGEYQLPPEQVHAVGVQALDQMKNATHAPVDDQPVAQGFKPEQFFANGGVVDDERSLQSSKTGNPMAAATPLPAAAAPPSAVTQPAPLDANAARQAANLPPMTQVNPGANLSSDAVRSNPLTAPFAAGSNTRGVVSATADEVGNQFAQGNYGRGFGAAVRGGLATIPASAVDSTTAVGRDLAPVANGVLGFGKGLFGINDNPAPTAAPLQRAAAAAPAAATPTPVVATAPTPAAATPAAPAAAPATPTDNNVTRVGNSYSGSNIRDGFTINGQAQSNGGFVGTPSSQLPATAATNPYPAAGFQPSGATAQPGPQVTIIGDSGAQDRLQRAIIDNATTPLKGSQNGQLTASQRGSLDRLSEDRSRADTALATNSANNAAALDRTLIDQQGGLQRTALQEGGANTRSEAGNQVSRDRLALEQTAQGFQTRSAQRQEKLYQQYDAAKTPEERSQIAQSIRDMQGKEPLNRFTAVAGGQEIDPTTQQLVTRPGQVFNNQTGQFVTQQQQGPRAPQAGEQRGGYRFKGGNPSDQKNWEKI